MSQRFMNERKELRQEVLLTVGKWLQIPGIQEASKKYFIAIVVLLLFLFNDFQGNLKLETSNKFLFCSQPLHVHIKLL